MIDPILHRPVLAALAMVLLAGAVGKIRDLSGWYHAVEQFGLLTAGLIRPAGLFILTTEFASGLLLLLPFARVAGAVLAIILLVIVTTAMLANVLRGRTDINCGCGGLGVDQHLSWGVVCRNLILLACASLLLFPELPRAYSVVEQIFSVAGALALAGLYATANQILATQPRLSDLRRR